MLPDREARPTQAPLTWLRIWGPRSILWLLALAALVSTQYYHDGSAFPRRPFRDARVCADAITVFS